MLKQLLKYEFKATSRVYGGLYLALALLSVVLGLSCRGQTLLPSNTGLWQFTVILSIVYAAVIAAIAVLCFVTTIQRFTKNLLGREGYLMHTLPVTETQLILSKLITSMVWVVVSILLGIVCITVMVGIGVFEPGMMDSLDWNSLRTMWRELKQQLGASIWLDLLWSVLDGLARLAGTILCIYAACMIAHQFKRHFTIAGILAFVGMNIVQNKLETLLGMNSVSLLSDTLWDDSVTPFVLTVSGNSWGGFLIFLLAAAFAAVYFFLTRWLMKNKLNLE